MRAKRYEFSDTVKGQAWARSGGKCEGCTNEIRPGNGPHYHHRYLRATDRGSNTLDNCQVLCDRPCHRLVTDTETIPQQARDRRVFEKRIGLRKTKRAFPKRVNPWGY